MRTTSRHRLARLPARAALAAALVLPASAIAAPAVDDSSAGPGPARDAAEGSTAEGIALVTGLGAGLLTEPERETPEGPFLPIDGSIDYGTAINTFGGGGMRSHEGQDMFAPAGTRLVSPVATTVLETGSDGGRGNWAAIYDKAADRTYTYFHMLEPAAVRAGQSLAPGERVGLVGCTGSCEGDHLHFEVRAGKDPYGKAIDPMPLLADWRPAPKG